MSITVVSDVHAGYNQSRTDDFIRFLYDFNYGELVLLGDIFDFWRKSNAKTILDNYKILELLADIPKVTYVVGNHDFSLLNYKERYKEDYHINVCKYYKTPNFYMDHGYILDVVGNMEPMTINEYEAFANRMCDAGEAAGYISSILYGTYEKIDNIINKKFHSNKIINSIANSPSSYIFLGKSSSMKYIYGHTHEALITDRCANTGCWLKGYPCTYVTIERDEMNLNTWCK